LVWNFPIDISFKTTNVYGWPRVAVSVYGLDFMGRDVVRGYGSALMPLVAGQHELIVDCYVPMASSWLNEWGAWFFGNPPEFYDSKFVCQADGREVTRVKSTGKLRIKLNVSTKGMNAIGYNTEDDRGFKVPQAQPLPVEQK
jgi:B9 domain-containing protein 1